jgi:hypothetical protein
LRITSEQEIVSLCILLVTEKLGGTWLVQFDVPSSNLAYRTMG